MNEFSFNDKYRLEIRWKKVRYDKEGVADLIGCYLCGPVMAEVDEMNAPDSISLDFSKQYIVFVPSYYIAQLSWKGVEHKNDSILLYDAVLSNKHLNSVPKLNNKDYIVVDTEDHVDDKHQYHLTYMSYLVKRSGELHIFRSK